MAFSVTWCFCDLVSTLMQPYGKYAYLTHGVTAYLPVLFTAGSCWRLELDCQLAGVHLLHVCLCLLLQG
jgi:hypothetical protein